MHICIAAPIRNREWIIDRYLDSLHAIHNYSKDISINYAFYIDRSTDDTESMIRNSLYPTDLYPYTIINGDKYTVNSSIKRGHWDCSKLAYIRNVLMNYAFFMNNKYIFFIDSDVILSPNSLQECVDKSDGGKIITAPAVRMGENVFNALLFDEKEKRYSRSGFNILNDAGFVDIAMTGGAHLVSLAAYKAGVRYSSIGNCEDKGFAESCRERNIPMRLVTKVRSEHWMTQDEPLVYDGLMES